MEVVMSSFTQERQDGLNFSKMTQNLSGVILEPFLSKFKTMPTMCLNLFKWYLKIHTIWYRKFENQKHVYVCSVYNNPVRKAYLSRSWAYSYPWLIDISSNELFKKNR